MWYKPQCWTEKRLKIFFQLVKKREHIAKRI